MGICGALGRCCSRFTCSCDCIYARVDKLMKSQAALKIIVMFTLLISDIDVFFLAVSMYEYLSADFTIGLVAVGAMAIVYLGGVYFGAMQRYKLDKHIIQCCEQGKHDNFFKSGQRRELDILKWTDQVNDHDAQVARAREREVHKRKQAQEAMMLVKWLRVSEEYMATLDKIEMVETDGLKKHVENKIAKEVEKGATISPAEIRVERKQLVEWDAEFSTTAVNILRVSMPSGGVVHYRGKPAGNLTLEHDLADDEAYEEPDHVRKARFEIQKAQEDEHVRQGLSLLLEALRFHKKKPAGFAVISDRLAPCFCESRFVDRVKKQDENTKVQAINQEEIEEAQHRVREALREGEANRNGIPFEPRPYDKLQGPVQKHERKMLKVNRFRSMTVKELYTEHQMIGTYLVEERQFVKNMLQVSHAVPLVRLMMFGWRTDIDPIDFAGILNANALYSFTLGFAQLGFSAYFLATISAVCPSLTLPEAVATVASNGSATDALAAALNASVVSVVANVVGNASGVNISSPPPMLPPMSPPTLPPMLPPLPPPLPDCVEAGIKLGPLISIFVSIISFTLSFCNICLDFARRLHMQEIERLEKEEAFEQVQMELANFKTTTKEQREKQKEESIKEYKPHRTDADGLDNPFKLTRDLMLIEAGYDAADLTYQSYASMRRQDLQSANGDLDKMEQMKNATFGHATKAINELSAQEDQWQVLKVPERPGIRPTPAIAAKAAKAKGGAAGLSA